MLPSSTILFSSSYKKRLVILLLVFSLTAFMLLLIPLTSPLRVKKAQAAAMLNTEPILQTIEVFEFTEATAEPQFALFCNEIPSETIVITDVNRYAEESVTIPGYPGIMRAVVSEDEKGNINVVSDEVLMPAQSTVIVEGVKEHISTGTYVLPAEGRFESPFGRRNIVGGSRNHQGWDVSNVAGTPVYASDGGMVVHASYDPVLAGYGRFVIIEHENGDTTWYAHLQSFAVSAGDVVKQGGIIGKMGSTGQVTGTHLHFEYHPGGGDAADPAAIFKTYEKYSMISFETN